ncbi:MAG: type II and III secretion system protein family protein [Candidatus Omnitrophota bacterium]|jgi:pilus assembly protein CpaC|nr:MAG: type II and III secretion system protein family protein [Candidatus Omnitrophota bacterium]
MKQAIRVFILLFILSAFDFLLPTAEALETIDQLESSQERIEIVINKSHLLTLKCPASRVSVVAPDIADVQILDPRQILITGKSPGETSLLFWTEDNETRMVDVSVIWNTAQIQKMLSHTIPDHAIETVSLEDGVALRGQVESADNVEQAVEIAQSYAPKVMNLLEVPGVHQVLLKVRIAEVARSFREEQGFNYLISKNSFITGSTLGGLMAGEYSPGGKVDISDAVTMFFGIPNEDIMTFIQALKTKGLISILAEPNLIARSGETASFLAGGEFPIPVVQGGLSNSVSIEYKEYGVRLNFTPTVLKEKTIHLDISPEVSDLDFTQGVKLGGYVVPVIVTRRAHTVIQLEDGQTFAIAGLISKSKQKAVRKIPGIGDVPLLGELFRGKEIDEKETELLIMVTPYLIAPLKAGTEHRMPTESSDQIMDGMQEPRVDWNSVFKKSDEMSSSDEAMLSSRGISPNKKN